MFSESKKVSLILPCLFTHWQDCVTITSSEILRESTAKQERQFISGFIEIMIYYTALDDIFYLNTTVTRESKINIKQTPVFVCTVYKDKQ